MQSRRHLEATKGGPGRNRAPVGPNGLVPVVAMTLPAIHRATGALRMQHTHTCNGAHSDKGLCVFPNKFRCAGRSLKQHIELTAILSFVLYHYFQRNPCLEVCHMGTLNLCLTVWEVNAAGVVVLMSPRSLRRIRQFACLRKLAFQSTVDTSPF